MKILLLHNRYQQAGGEDRIVLAEKSLLEQHGHQTYLFELTNDYIQGISSKIQTALSCIYSLSSRKDVIRQIALYSPDIVHVHNFFPLLSPSIYDACQSAHVPVVQTLNNYRIICPGAMLMRKGKICELCLGRSPYHALFHKCYRNSLLGTLSVSTMVAFHRFRKTWLRKVRCFIANMTEGAKEKFIKAGIPAEQIIVKPNFIRDPFPETILPSEIRSGALFVGRLSPEKGILTLLKAWQKIPDIPLLIAGNGPLYDQLQVIKPDNVTLLGWLTADQISRKMREAKFIVMPSEWYEGFPMVLVEAFAHEVPAIVSQLGAMAEIVRHGVTGLHFQTGNSDDLAQKISWMNEHPFQSSQMGKNARQEFLNQYTPEKNYRMLMDIYNLALK